MATIDGNLFLLGARGIVMPRLHTRSVSRKQLFMQRLRLQMKVHHTQSVSSSLAGSTVTVFVSDIPGNVTVKEVIV